MLFVVNVLLWMIFIVILKFNWKCLILIGFLKFVKFVVIFLKFIVLIDEYCIKYNKKRVFYRLISDLLVLINVVLLFWLSCFFKVF